MNQKLITQFNRKAQLQKLKIQPISVYTNQNRNNNSKTKSNHVYLPSPSPGHTLQDCSWKEIFKTEPDQASVQRQDPV